MKLMKFVTVRFGVFECFEKTQLSQPSLYLLKPQQQS